MLMPLSLQLSVATVIGFDNHIINLSQSAYAEISIKVDTLKGKFWRSWHLVLTN